ncbi:hypothetical protein E8F20_06030 [Pseudomonas sp. BN415]|uniref:hypothetical protein n=1 Tax=Pseudomonas sp. BN415 TaxID=2567889 RepID=UPI0024540933|nr:hypothetical protein [Pseudomonas sp. BN415]MDH4581434.1 hypothetical protein [Pseudomonas sp. BN415]
MTQQTQGTPSATWRAKNQPDPHGDRYNCERAALCMGSLTDDQLANAVFMCDHRTSLESIAYLTAAKDRIRWLSRKLEEVGAAPQSSICCWTYDSDSFSWDTGCGEKWTLMDGGPKENGMHFCHACGGKLEEESNG